MRLAAPLVSVVLLSALSCAPVPAPAPKQPPRDTPEQMIAAANDLDRRFLVAFNAHDVETLSGLYWDDPQVASFPPDTMKYVGLDAIRTGMTSMFESMPPATLELTESHHLTVGDAVSSWGLWRMTMTMPDGTSTTQDGRFSDVKAKRGGKWVYLVDHVSVPMVNTPPVAPPPTPGSAGN